MGRARVALESGESRDPAERCSSHSACRTFASPTAPASTRWSSRRCRSRRLERGDQPPPPPPEGPGVAAVPAGGLRFEYSFTRFERSLCRSGAGPFALLAAKGRAPPGAASRARASSARTADGQPGPLGRPPDGRGPVLQAPGQGVAGRQAVGQAGGPITSTARRRRAASLPSRTPQGQRRPAPAGRSPSAPRPPPAAPRPGPGDQRSARAGRSAGPGTPAAAIVRNSPSASARVAASSHCKASREPLQPLLQGHRAPCRLVDVLHRRCPPCFVPESVRHGHTAAMGLPGPGRPRPGHAGLVHRPAGQVDGREGRPEQLADERRAA